jgi:hypothetical protein
MSGRDRRGTPGGAGATRNPMRRTAACWVLPSGSAAHQATWRAEPAQSSAATLAATRRAARTTRRGHSEGTWPVPPKPRQRPVSGRVLAAHQVVAADQVLAGHRVAAGRRSAAGPDVAGPSPHRATLAGTTLGGATLGGATLGGRKVAHRRFRPWRRRWSSARCHSQDRKRTSQTPADGAAGVAGPDHARRRPRGWRAPACQPHSPRCRRRRR